MIYPIFITGIGTYTGYKTHENAARKCRQNKGFPFRFFGIIAKVYVPLLVTKFNFMVIPKDDLQTSLFYWPDTGDNLDTIDPIEVMTDFFDNFSFDDVQPLLWGVFKFMLENDDKNKESLTRFHIHFYERLSDLCTASYIMAKKHHLAKVEKDKS